MRFGVDNIPNTLDLVDANGNIDYNRITTFNAVDFASLISYARKIQQIKVNWVKTNILFNFFSLKFGF